MFTANKSQNRSRLLEGAKLVASAGTPVPVSATPVLLETVELFGQKARGTNNTGLVYVGANPAVNTQLRPLSAGGSLVLVAPVGRKLDLSQLFIDAVTNGDGVTYLAIE